MASRQRKGKQVTHAFTVKWIWAWAIMHGHKTAEYRNSPPEVLKGRCAVHLSRTYDRDDFDADREYVRTKWEDGEAIEREMPSYEKLSAYAGKIVGTVDFDASDGVGTRWELAKPKWLRRFIAVRGHLGLWELSPDVAAEIKRQMSDD